MASSSDYFKKLRWITQARGLTSAERNVLRLLADQASGSGYIEKYYSRSIGNACELQRTRVFEILRTLQDVKRFISERKKRPGPNGVQLSNGYRLDLQRNHPPDSKADPGAGYGKLIMRLAADDLVVPDSRRAEMDVAFEHADSYYNPTRRVLTIWVESQRQASGFYDLRESLQIHQREWVARLAFPPPVAYEFLHPDGAYSTAPPRNRRKSRPTQT